MFALAHDENSALSTGWTLSLLNDGDVTGPGVNEYGRGILGKWQYAAELGVFVGLKNPYDGEVWFYKPDAVAGVSSMRSADFFTPAAVPEASHFAMFFAGLPLIWWSSRRSRRPAA